LGVSAGHGVTYRICEAVTDPHMSPIGGEKIIEADEGQLGEVDALIPSTSCKARPYLDL